MKDKTKILETFENPNPERDYTIIHKAPEFTSLCPKTGQPDFGTIILEYNPNELCVELKSYKLYLNSYRNEGMFFEAVTNKILEDLVKVLDPSYLKITAKFNVRGGIKSIVEVEYDEFAELEDFDDFDEDEDFSLN
ncbi:MAG: NADPH-dependent 7-cyano-7-deazaguanine reductase QueF [Ignavibacteriales bacterium CG18_big_fil_WC_8_21_14_2_50_31_20]|nr:MAG: NADPH-dependent 7-cyano-7-deazaguanine reductase QueF [Ignavibacteriales bacterium CG18_big_fil_WC_8_21_14_2_50_31_20]